MNEERWVIGIEEGDTATVLTKQDGTPHMTDPKLGTRDADFARVLMPNVQITEGRMQAFRLRGGMTLYPGELKGKTFGRIPNSEPLKVG